MKILFLVHNLGKTRHFESVIDELTRRGHAVTLGAARKRRKPLKLTGRFANNPRLDVVPFPVHRVDRWRNHVRPLRQARDYLRFLEPRYTGAARLASRAAEYAPPGWPERLRGDAWLARHHAWARRGLALAEALVPSERFFELSIQAEQPDLILVTPLVDFGSYQTDYVKAAHRLGIPVAFVPFSWDNLTNRGLIRVAPDRVLVWNRQQRDEAVLLHGVPADRVVIVGAPRFDEFFAMRCTTTREGFFADAGLDPGAPLLLYLCSSPFVAPREVEFVRAWVRALRDAPDASVRACQVLVRPHPAHVEQWEGGLGDDLPGASLSPDDGRMQADQRLYDSLVHCAAVVGLNTSAMIEAGIVGRPVLTVRSPEFAGGQEQTLHFHYLLAEHGGLVQAAGSMDEHMAQLAAALDAPTVAADRARRFVESFVRPHGLDTPATPLMVEAIEASARIRKRPARASLYKAAGRPLLLAALDRRALRAGRRRKG